MPLELSADVPDGACKTCHPEPSGGRRHSPAFEHDPTHQSARCISCHAGVVHGRDPDRPPLGSMAFCQECHNNAKRESAKRDGTSASGACETCHAPAHVDAGECAACHQLTDWGQPVPLSPSISPASCRKCHPRPRDFAGPTSVFAHQQHSKVGCSSCHAGILHPSARPSSPVTMEECLRCHDGATREGITASAACETCHEPPHAAVGGCAQCHTVDGWKKAVPLADTVAAAACLECHRLPENVAYGSSGFSHGAHRATPCASCHAGTPHPVSGVAARMPMKACVDCHQRTGAPTGCTTCHAPPHAGYGNCAGCHSRSSWKSRFVHPFRLVGRHASLACSKCHGGTPVIGSANTRLPTGCSDCHGGSEGPGHDGLNDCDRCHDPSGWKPPDFAHPQVPGMESKLGDMSCAECHPAGYSSASCAPCHAETGP